MLWKRHANLSVSMTLLTATVLALAGCGSDKSSSPLDDGDPSGNDPAPPTAPTDLAVSKATSAGLRLVWDGSPDLDVVGYDVYIYDPSPYRDDAYVRLNTSLLAREQFSFENLEAQVAYYFKVRAVNGTGQSSAATPPLEVTWNGGPLQENSQGGGRDESGRNPSGPGTPPDPDGSEHPRPGDGVGDDHGR